MFIYIGGFKPIVNRKLRASWGWYVLIDKKQCFPAKIYGWTGSRNDRYHFIYPTVIHGLCYKISGGLINMRIQLGTAVGHGWMFTGFGANTHIAVAEFYYG